MTESSPPFWIIIVTQLLGVLGEVFGQRTKRVCYERSNVEILISVGIYSFAQCFIILGIFQLALPHSITENQGPFSLIPQIIEHPGLLIIGAINLVYWFCQVVLLGEPLGVVLLVLAFLLATFFIAPFSWLFGLEVPFNVSPGSIILGFLGTILCLIEINNKKFNLNFLKSLGNSSDARPFLEIAQEEPYQEEIVVVSQESPVSPLRHTINISCSFIGLIVTTSLYITLTIYFQRKANINMFGFSALDQMLLPFFLIPFAFVVNRFSVLRKLVEPTHHQNTKSFKEVLKSTWHHTDVYTFLVLIGFQGLLLAREFFYFYVATTFDVSYSYLELTLVRILLSWIASVGICFWIPEFINATAHELDKTFAVSNISLRIVGSILVLFSLLVLNKVL